MEGSSDTAISLGAREMFPCHRDIEIVGESSNENEASEFVHRLAPEVVIIDLTIAEMDGMTATRTLTEQGMASHVLVFTMHTEERSKAPNVSRRPACAWIE